MTEGIENKEQGRPSMRSHLWAMENIEREDNGTIVRYDMQCRLCRETRHVDPPPPDVCPGPSA